MTQSTRDYFLRVYFRRVRGGVAKKGKLTISLTGLPCTRRKCAYNSLNYKNLNPWFRVGLHTKPRG
jgi:hypothetical protein